MFHYGLRLSLWPRGCSTTHSRCGQKDNNRIPLGGDNVPNGDDYDIV